MSTLRTLFSSLGTVSVCQRSVTVRMCSEKERGASDQSSTMTESQSKNINDTQTVKGAATDEQKGKLRESDLRNIFGSKSGDNNVNSENFSLRIRGKVTTQIYKNKFLPNNLRYSNQTYGRY